MNVNWGILGAANITKVIIPAIHISENGKCIAIASRKFDKAKEISQQYQIGKIYGNYQDLLEDSKINAVYIPLANHLHKEWAIKALKNGKHVLCEKPFALSVKESNEMFLVAKDNNLIIMEAFMYRFDPKIAKIKQILKEGTIGEIKFIDFSFSHNLIERFTKTNNYRMNKYEGGGSMYDLGVYGINLTHYLLDESPVKILNVNVTKEKLEDIDRTMYLQLLYKRKIIVSITASFEFYGNYMIISGSEGVLEVRNIISQNEGELHLKRFKGKYKEETQKFPAFNSYNAMINHVNDCIIHKKEILITQNDTLETLKVVENVLDKMNTL